MKRTYRTNTGLSNINKTLNNQLARQNEILRQMLDIMPKPAGRFTRALETAVLIASAFGIVTAIESMVKLITGG